MGEFSNFKPVGRLQNKEVLKIHRDGHISGYVNSFMFIDKDTGHHICYMPAMGISGYGSTDQEAIEMIKDSMDDLFSFILSKDEMGRRQEMANLGWTRHKIFSKEYSKLFIDEDGVLQNLREEGVQIKRMALSAA